MCTGGVELHACVGPARVRFGAIAQPVRYCQPHPVRGLGRALQQLVPQQLLHLEAEQARMAGDAAAGNQA